MGRRINCGLTGQPVHRAVVELVEQGWRALLELSHLRQGGKSVPWKRWWQTLLAVPTAAGRCPMKAGQGYGVERPRFLDETG